MISISHVVHGYRYISIYDEAVGFRTSGECQVNVNCEEGQNWQNEKNAIALILINGNRWCTGSLINNTAQDNQPLLLTASHCLYGHDAINNPELDDYSFWWNYESPDCNTPTTKPIYYTTTGAKILANKSASNGSDFALLYLTEDPRNCLGVRLYYLGWDNSGFSGSSFVGIHHPSGDIKKIATLMGPTYSYSMGSTSNSYWKHYWSQTINGYSVTEGGSSGSPLINNERHIIGQLYGGSKINCSDPANDVAIYGKFSASWNGNGATDNRRKLQSWLDPLNSGVSTLDGIGRLKTSDLYVRDVVGDNGTEPSVTHGIMWDSPDIWIEDMNGNKINNPYGNAEYKVCVRVHNRSEVSSTGEERLFLNWAKAGIDLVWRGNWTSDNIFDCGAVKGGVIGSANGVKIPVIAANGNEVVKVTWLTPMSEDYENCTDAGAENWHFCLTARVHDGEEIEGENENLLNMGVFTERNNNVAWKNISILNSKFPRAVVSVSNPYKEKHNFSIKYKHTANQSNELLQDFADVYITLSEGLLKAWQEGGQNSQGVKRARENKFLITDNEAVFDNLVLEPKELHSIATEVNFYTQKDSKMNRFDFDIIEYCNDCENRIIGGEHYTAIKDGTKDFKAMAIEDKTVIKGREASFTANIINEQAEYVWYNQQGDTLTKGQTLTTRPINSQRYILEVTAKEDGYRDKDTVSVNVKRARINTLTGQERATCEIHYRRQCKASENKHIDTKSCKYHLYTKL